MKKAAILSANTLKLIALVAMTFDHTALLFVDADTLLWIVMRLIGRLTMPIMCFFIAEGYHYTKNRRKYLVRMAMFAAISQPFYFIILFGRLPTGAAESLTNWNVLYTFCVSLVLLLIVDSKKVNTLDKQAVEDVISSSNHKGNTPKQSKSDKTASKVVEDEETTLTNNIETEVIENIENAEDTIPLLEP
ncbi:MAG: hypothetical protein LBC86_03640 [Oscillospiraceae bacterium]|jgi:hypothetical protein|nr:hypothetical protein [Oscillospiraceae bacterium]